MSVFCLFFEAGLDSLFEVGHFLVLSGFPGVDCCVDLIVPIGVPVLGLLSL